MAIYPEGLAFDPSREAFITSSALFGTISLVDLEGNHSVLVNENVFMGSGTFGLEVDVQRDRLLAVSTNIRSRTNAKLFIFELSTGTLLHEINLGALTPGSNFLNDVTIDEQGNAYITNSAQGIIYLVDVDGNASVFLNDVSLAPSDAVTTNRFERDCLSPGRFLTGFTLRNEQVV